MADKTPTLGLNIPEYQDPRWDIKVNENWELLDELHCMCPALVATLTIVKPVDIFVYDTTKDSDGGAWRDRCQSLSWYTEILNTTTRGGTRKFPVIVGIVAEADKVTFFDLTMPDAPMWMVFDVSGDRLLRSAPSSLSMSNGLLSVATSWGYTKCNFLKDGSIQQSASGENDFLGNIADRNILKGFGSTYGNPIINHTCNDVAMTIIDNAYVDSETGIAVPVIAVATDGGVSVIDGPAGVGTVVDSGRTGNTDHVGFDVDNVLYFGQGTGIAIRYASDYITDGFGIILADSNPITSPVLLTGTQNAGNYRGGVSIGQALGLTLLDEDTTTPENGMVNYITSLYQSGWMQGDIKGAWLADTVTGMFNPGEEVEDRSVNDNPLTIVGTALTRTPVAAGAELVEYSGFTATDYLEQAYNADLDFGTGDFYIMGWLTPNSTGTYIAVDRSDADTSPGFNLGIVGGKVRAYMKNATSGSTNVTTLENVTVNKAIFCVMFVRSSMLYLIVDGVEIGSISSAGYDMDSVTGAATLAVGVDVGLSIPFDGSISLLRMGAGAPSDEQIAKIYEDEKDLFTPEAKCTLQGTSDNVTSLALDDATGKLYVGTGSGATTFNGLLASPEEVCVRKDDGTIACTDNNEYISISAQREIVIHGIADNSIVNAGTVNLRAALIELEAQLAGKQDKLDIQLNPYIDFPNLTTPPPWKEGRVFYNAVKHCLSFYNDVTDMTVDIPLEELIRVKNTSGATILNGKPVYSNGVSGGVATIALAQANLFSTSSVPGITTHDIADGAEGFITHAGTIGGDFSAFTAGEQLYLSDTVAGEFTDVAPDIATAIGIVLDNAVDGVLHVKINSNIALPTITGVLNDGAAGAYIDSNYEAIVDYTSSYQVGIPVDNITGQITIPTVGLYKININFNVTFDELTSNNPVVVELQVWNVTTYSEELVIPCTAVKGGNGVALSPTFTHDFTTPGEIFELRVRCQEENLNNAVYQLVSFDVESIHLRA